MRPPLPLAGLLLAAALVTGCAHAEYDIVRPQDLAQHVGTKGFATVPVEPLEYQMVAYEDHLILRAYNRAREPIQLLADQSTVVDPNGQSHPLPARNQTILPDSYVKLILPPNRPRVVPGGPTIGIGIGGVFGSAYPYHRHYGYGRYGYGFAGYDPFWDTPRYYAVYGGDDNVYWEWADGGQVRLVLVYLRGAGEPPVRPGTQPEGGPNPPGPATFTHEFVIRQKKV